MNCDLMRWKNVMATIAESSVALDDLKVMEEVDRNRRIETADATREIFFDELKKFRKEALRRAWDEYALEVAAIRKRNFGLPQTPLERRQLLLDTFNRFPQMRDAFLTVQHREFRTLTDADVESFLRQLEALGAFRT